MDNFFSKSHGSVSISKNMLLAILSVVIVGMAIWIALEHFGNKQGKYNSSSSQANYIDEFDMIDPENPMTKSDHIIRLRKRGKELESEKRDCELFISRAKYSLSEQTKFPFPATFSEKDVLTQDAIDFLSFYYRFPFFMNVDNSNTVYKLSGSDSNSGESVQSVVDRLRMDYSNTMLSHLRSANIWVYFDPNGLLDFKKQILNQPYKPEILQALPTETNRMFSELIKNLEARNAAIQTELVSNSAEYNSRMQEYRDTRYDMSGKAISWGIIAFVSTAIILYIAGLRSRDKMRIRVSNGDISPILHEDLKMSMWYSVYLITVLLLIITIFVLGLARLLSENTLAALLGGIAGYVLNNKQSDNTPKSVNTYAAGTVTTDDANPGSVNVSVQPAPNNATSDADVPGGASIPDASDQPAVADDIPNTGTTSPEPDPSDPSPREQ